MSDLFLSTKEVEELTGFKRKQEQRRWLKDNAIHFYQARDGRPVIKRSLMTGNEKGNMNIVDDINTPNFEAI